MHSPNQNSPAASEDFASVLARFASPLRLQDLPPAVVEATKLNIFDTLACAAAGSSAHSASRARELAVQWGGTAQATILGYGDKVPAHHAAWVNGTMCHARDYDDTHDAAVLHAGVSVVPAALAAAELRGKVSGADFIAAVAAGLETICRLGVAARIGPIEAGWMYTGLFGNFSATIAASRALGLDVAETVNSLGITYSQAGGIHQVTRDAAHTKSMQPGFAARSALWSVQLTRQQVRGAQATFEGIDGFKRVYMRDELDSERLRAGLGRDYELLQLSYKPYPCCRLTHTAIEAAYALAATEGFDVSRVRRIRVGVNRQSYEAVCTPVEVRKAPKTLVQAQFSIPYTVATALLRGSVGLSSFSEAALAQADVLALAERVDGCVDEDIDRHWGRSVTPAQMEVEYVDGRKQSLRVDVPLGHPSRPMSAAAQEAKAADCFRAAARPLRDDGARELHRLVQGLDQMDDVRELTRVLVPVA